jgi:hypothetical protein
MLLIDAKLAHENTENLLKQSGAKAIIVNEEEPYSVPSFRLNEIKNAEEDATFAPHWANQVIFCSSGTTGDAKMMVTDGEALCYQIAGALNMPKETLDILHSGRTNILCDDPAPPHLRLHRGVPLVHLLWQSPRLSDHDEHDRSFHGDQESPGHPSLQRPDVLGCRRPKFSAAPPSKARKPTTCSIISSPTTTIKSRARSRLGRLGLRQTRLPEESLRHPDRILHLRRRLSFAKDPQRHQWLRLSAL